MSECTLTGTIGVVVQIALAVLVLVVLITEFLIEHLIYILKGGASNDELHKPRDLRHFWFDSFKICTGALVSHAFNLGVSEFVQQAANADECAVYAIAFYYEACGVPFVQLLQYGVIQYSHAMRQNSRVSKMCQHYWDYIAFPGIYGKDNRFTTHGCISSCGGNDGVAARKKICIFSVVLLLSVIISGSSSYFFYYFESKQIYIYGSVGILVFIFLTTSIVAPCSSWVQTGGWVFVKLIEKTVWSLLAIAQTNSFAKWSLSMSTGDATKDAWLFIAIIPIIMNAFMFFMFSRISKLKIPCLHLKIRENLDEQLDKELYINNQNITNSNNSINIHQRNNINNTNHNYQRLNGNDQQNNSNQQKFDINEAIRVGIIYTCIINVTLLIIAIVYLIIESASQIWLLSITMLVAPLGIALFGIFFFKYMIENKINIFCCFLCCKSNNGSSNHVGDHDSDSNSNSSGKLVHHEVSLHGDTTQNRNNDDYPNNQILKGQSEPDDQMGT